jgi:hypothetical protein
MHRRATGAPRSLIVTQLLIGWLLCHGAAAQDVSAPPDDIPVAPPGAPTENLPKWPPVLPPQGLGLPPFTPSNVNVSNLVGNEAEVSVAINPTDPDNLVVVGHAPGFTTMNTFFSLDGGETWTLVPLGPADDGQEDCLARVDPTVAFDAQGNVYAGYFTSLCMGGDTRTLWIARSSDGGQTYSQVTAVAVGEGIDKEIVGTGPDPLVPGQQNVYVAYRLDVLEGGSFDLQLHVAASYDGGATFPVDVIVNDDSLAGLDLASFGVPAVGPAGELFVVWDDFSDNPTSSRVMVDVSYDGGLTWGADRSVATTAVTRDNANGFTPCSGTRYHIPAQPTRGILTVPSIAVDRSGGLHDGRLYAAYTVVGAGGASDTDVVVRHSDDDGGSWSSPVVVHDDGGTHSQFLPWLAVDHGAASQGKVAVAFYDARNDPQNQRVEAYLAVSEDGGDSFLPNVRVSAGASEQSLANPGAWCQNYL